MENPEIIADAIYLLQERAEADKAKQASEALQGMQDALTNNELDPVGGNTDGSITIVEFFDYNCGYCKRASGTLKQLIKDNPNLKVVYKEWPILSESSSIAARIALAINQAEPDKYEEFHHALLSARSIRSADDVWKVAEQVGIDRAMAESKLNSPEVEQHLSQTSTLAQSLGITGTPAFVVGDKILKGAYPIEQIQAAIDSQS
jgi:protein-disulfide isomerase